MDNYDLPELKLGSFRSQYLFYSSLTTHLLFIDLELSLAHTVHDHVKRDHIFCLSTNNGNTYYMQVRSDQINIIIINFVYS